MADIVSVGRLRWLCRRGMKELDLMMLTYLEQHYTQASDAHKAAFCALLDMQDPQLYALILERDSVADKDVNHVLEQLRNTHKT